MKKIISKLALTLGLILMFGSSAWAATTTITFNVKCYVVAGGETKDVTDQMGTGIADFDGKVFGYTLNSSAGILSGWRVEGGSNNATLTISKNGNNNPSPLKKDNLNQVIQGLPVDDYSIGYDLAAGNPQVITITYKKLEPVTKDYTIQCTLNGTTDVTSQMGTGSYGYTVNTNVDSQSSVITNADATTLTMSRLGQNPEDLNGETAVLKYITPREVTLHNEKCTVSVLVKDGGGPGKPKIITLAYTGPKEYTISLAENAPAGVTYSWAGTGELVGNKLYTNSTDIANNLTVTGFDADTYIASVNVNGQNITISFVEKKTYNVVVTGAPEGQGGFNAKSDATKSGNTITVAANLSAANVADYVEAVKVDGYDAVVSWDGTNVTVTYTQLYKASYDVVCTVGGTTHALDNSYGYTVKTAYSASAEGVASAKNANPLVMQNLGEEPSPLTEENLNIYIAPITNANYDATMSIEGTTITIAYVVKPAESKQWTVTCTLNGTTQEMNGIYGYTIKTAYDGTNTGIYNSTNDATSFNMRGAANEIDSITNANYTDYITVRQVAGCQVKVEIRRGTDHTIRIIYDNRFDLVENDLCYTITTAATETTPGEVSVALANYDAKSVNVPSTVEINGNTYNVTSIAAYGFTDGFTNSSNTNRDSAIYPLNEDQYEFCQFTSSTNHWTVDTSDRHDTGNSRGFDTYSRWCNAYNANLQEVTFDHPCYITQIGTSAFEGCVNLQSFTSPLSVESYGVAVFRGCKNMKTFKFETNDDGSAKLTILPEATFFGCQSLGVLRLPDGIITIDAEALKYMLKLTSITLPNTLKTIGKEFLCTSLSLETLTLPASVTSMGGGSFHGCNALRSVYLLGPASALDKGGDSNETFKANQAFCADGVQNCTFYTTSAYIADYQASSSWSLIDGKNNTTAASLKNWLVAEIPGQKREFVPGKWMTFCLPQSKIFFEFNGSSISPTPGYQDDFGVKARPVLTADGDDAASSRPVLKVEAFENGWDYTDEEGKTTHYDGFGEGALVAKLEKVWLDEEDRNLYHTQYRIIDHADIKPYLPYFILPEIPVDPETKEPITDGEGKFPNLNICLWTSTDELNGLETGWNAAQTAEHVFSMRCEDETREDDNPATIQWVAQVSRNERLYPQDIYFKSNGSTGLKINAETGETEAEEIGKFYIIPDNSVKVTLKSCSAFWRVLQDGASADVKLNSTKVRGSNISVDPTSINEVENEKPVRVVIDGIYDINGRKLNVSQDQLPDGMYIMDGKKVLKK